MTQERSNECQATKLFTENSFLIFYDGPLYLICTNSFSDDIDSSVNQIKVEVFKIVIYLLNQFSKNNTFTMILKNEQYIPHSRLFQLFILSFSDTV